MMKAIIISFGLGFLTHYLASQLMNKNEAEGLQANKKVTTEVCQTQSKFLNEALPTAKLNLKPNAIEKSKSNTENKSETTVERPSLNNDFKNRIQKNNKKIIRSFRRAINDRTIRGLYEEDYPLIAEANVESTLDFAIARRLHDYDSLEPFIGVYEGTAFLFSSIINGIESKRASLEMNISKGKEVIRYRTGLRTNVADASYKVEIEGRGSSSGSGTPNNFKKSLSNDNYYIQFGSSGYLEVMQLGKRIKANVYDNDKFIGFMVLDKVR